MNLQILKSVENRRFLATVRNAPEDLSRDQSQEFFEITLSLLRGNIPGDAGIAVLEAINTLMNDEYHRQTFVSGRFLVDLPFSRRDLFPPSLEIAYKLVSTEANTIDAEFAGELCESLDDDPNHCLILIARYSVQFDQLDNPWPLLDLLITYGSSFAIHAVIHDYVRLLCHLCHTFRAYFEARGKHCWCQFASLLDHKSPEVICACYQGLTCLAPIYPDGPLPIDIVSLHLTSQDTMSAALSVLGCRRISTAMWRDHQSLIPNLFTAATKSVKATLLLMEIAQTRPGVRKFIDKTEWLSLGLPGIGDTLRLFLVVFSHREVRSVFLRMPQFVPFLASIASKGKPGLTALVCTVLRRTMITHDLVISLSKTGFLGRVFKAAQPQDEVSLGIALVLADTIARVGLVDDLVPFCDIVAKAAMSRSPMAHRACYVAATMASYERLAVRLADIGLLDFFEQNQQNPKIARSAARFLRKFPDNV